MEAPFAEDRMIEADGKEQKPQRNAPQKTGADGGRQPTAAAGKVKAANKGGFRDRNGGTNGGFGGFRRGRYGDGPRPLKRSDNPDVIYGRDIEDDADHD